MSRSDISVKEFLQRRSGGHHDSHLRPLSSAFGWLLYTIWGKSIKVTFSSWTRSHEVTRLPNQHIAHQCLIQHEVELIEIAVNDASSQQPAQSNRTPGDLDCCARIGTSLTTSLIRRSKTSAERIHPALHGLRPVLGPCLVWMLKLPQLEQRLRIDLTRIRDTSG